MDPYQPPTARIVDAAFRFSLTRAAAALSAALAVPSVLILVLVSVLSPGVSLQLPSPTYWLILLAAGAIAVVVANAAHVRHAIGTAAIGAAFGVACIVLFALLHEFFPHIAGAT
jgi:prepilin signal peptidase PulO-like enzyme (type II secretory pathway)